MNRQGLGLVLEGLEEDIAAFLGRPKQEDGKPVKFDLALINGTHKVDKNSAMLYICTDEVEIIEGQAETVEEGLRKILTQLRAPLSPGPPDLSSVSLEAISNLMWEVAGIAAEISGVEPEIGLHHGPHFGILLGRDCCFFEGFAGAKISFWKVAGDCHFESTGETILDALEAVLDQAYQRLKEIQ